MEKMFLLDPESEPEPWKNIFERIYEYVIFFEFFQILIK